MTVAEIVTKENQVGTHDVFSPRVGVLVTADVKVIQYSSSSSLGPTGGAKCEIITSLNAIVKELFDANDTSACKSQDLSEDFSEQPLIRRSKKNTQLNKISCFYSSNTKNKFQIDRMVIMPKIGCTTGNQINVLVKRPLLVKTSKSWDPVKKTSPDFKEKGPLKAQSMDTIYYKMNNTRSSSGFKTTKSLKEPDIHESLKRLLVMDDLAMDSDALYNEYSSENELVTILKPPIDSATTKCKCVPPDTTENQVENERKAVTLHDKNQVKTTRNVSILHKPKTRDKSTSTTTLTNGTSLYEHLNGSLKGLLMPYTLAGKEFPSEIILKLTPKKEAMKNVLNEVSNDQSKLADSSELNLLAPKLHTVQKKEKKQTGFLSCLFCFRKKEGDNDSLIADSLNSSTKEVYFPSVVEVYNGEKKSIKEVSSILTVNNSNYSSDKLKKTYKIK